MLHTIIHRGGISNTFYIFPLSQSLADWATYAIEMTESGSPNQGRYSASVDDVYGTEWVVFSQDTQPTNWNTAYIARYSLREQKVLSLMQDLLEGDVIPPEDRTFRPKRGVELLAMSKRDDETMRVYVDLGAMLGVNEALGSTDTFSAAVTTGSMTVTAGSYEKTGKIASFEVAGGSSGSNVIELEVESETSEVIEAVLPFDVTTSSS